jgi:hypothetical protein
MSPRVQGNVRFMIYEPDEKSIFATNGQSSGYKPRPTWHYAMKNVGIVWIVALLLSWLMVLGAVKLIKIVEEILRRSV